MGRWGEVEREEQGKEKREETEAVEEEKNEKCTIQYIYRRSGNFRVLFFSRDKFPRV